MNIYNYIDDFGIYTFEEKPINLIDKVIFSFLSYVNFVGIVDYNKITIKEAGRIHLGMHKLDEVNIIALKEANKLLRHIKDTKRYKDCLLYNYVYEGTEHLQFSAICIEFQKNKVFFAKFAYIVYYIVKNDDFRLFTASLKGDLTWLKTFVTLCLKEKRKLCQNTRFSP